jgi:hypothetical protein
MKKISIFLFLLLLLTSCWKSFELNQKNIDDTYKTPDRSINLSNKWIKSFVDLNTYISEKEVNNIYLNDNNIQTINVSWYNKLWRLDISNNDIRFISDLKLPITIRHLNLSHNNLTNLKWLEKYTKLKTLDISYNNLEESGIVVKWLKNLKYINVEWNKVNDELISKLNQFNSVYLSNNKKPFSK